MAELKNISFNEFRPEEEECSDSGPTENWINYIFTYQIPIRSDGITPLENLPVGIFPLKSLPYGGKLHLIIVLMLLLLPGSAIESPNTKTAGTDSFLFWVAASPFSEKYMNRRKKKNIIEKEGVDKEVGFWERSFIVFFFFFFQWLLASNFRSKIDQMDSVCNIEGLKIDYLLDSKRLYLLDTLWW